MIVISVICSIITGNTQQLSAGMMNGAEKAVQLLITLFGVIVFWSGIMRIAEKSGIINYLVKVLSPVLKKIFPDINPNSEAFKSICMNISANLLGVGNAATPFGLKAMSAMQKHNLNKDTATDDMVVFVVMNTASMQIIPATVGYLRQSYGSDSPFSIIPAVLVSSAVALLVALLLSKFMNKVSKWK
jgi:spore maturation protein A